MRGTCPLEPNYPTLIEENAIAAGKAVDPALFSEAERLIERALRPHNRVSTSRSMKEVQMSDSVYKVVMLIGTSPKCWEKAAKAAVEAASQSLRELRIAEVVKQDMVITDGKVEAYRTKVRVSFKYEGNA